MFKKISTKYFVRSSVYPFIMVLLFLNAFGCLKEEKTTVFNHPEEHPLEAFGIVLVLSQGFADYTTVRTINATPDKVFSIITDYANYKTYFPELHDSIEIISTVTSGKGVIWRSTGTYMGHSFSTVWEVTEYAVNQRVVMRDTQGEGVVTLTVEDLGGGVSRYTYTAHLFMFLPIKDQFFAIFEREADAVKRLSEAL